jgi:hypothetical protein
MGKPPGDLQADLRASRRFFDPVAQGQRLRKELAKLPELPGNITDPGPPMTFPTGPTQRLLTPEGRCALDLLQRLPDRAVHVFTEAELGSYDRMLAELYRGWGRHRLESVVELLVGSSKPLQIPAAGVVIALLVNRCTSEDRALTRFAAGTPRMVVDQAFFLPVQAFADALSPGRRRNRTNAHLVSGWMLYEAARRLGNGLVVQDARAGKDGKVWIRPDHEDQVIEIVTRDLARGHRTRLTTERFADAYDALVVALRKELPKLAGFGLVHERPLDTTKLRDRLLAGLSSHLAASA